MRENFKLRKMKVGLVSVAITMLYIMTNGEAEASEGSQTVKNPKVNATEEIKAKSQPVQSNQEVSSDQTKKNFVKLDPIKPGAQKVTGTTLPNQLILLSIDKKDVDSVETGDLNLVTANEDGKFEYDLNGRKIVHNQEIEVTSSSMDGLYDEEDEDALKPLIFKTKVTSLEDIEKAETKYDHTKVNKVKVLDNVKEDLQVDEIYGSLYHTDKGKGILDKEGTKVIKGKTKFANAVVKVYSELGEAQLFPDLQVNEKGEFSFDSHGAGFRLQNGEKLNFAVVDPITGKLLSNEFVSKEIDIEETPEQKADREFDERMENTPAYYKLYGDKIVGFDTNDFPITWFYPLGEKKVERTTPKLEK
ncbi:TPA: hypothetical protein QE924_000053 [Staphylococcus aureus]|nr:hypothetical protein [Staphylococcus aureus]